MSRLSLNLLGFFLAAVFAAIVFVLVYVRRSKPRGTRNPGFPRRARDIRVKTCPSCAAVSVLDARTCKHCGGALETGGESGPA